MLNLFSSASLNSGNKPYKLKYNIRAMRDAGQSTLLTFGGPWSNHIAAVAEAGMNESFKTIVVIRGEEPKELTETLKIAQHNGMQLEFISRSDFRKHRENRFESFRNTDTYVLPEGGSNALAVKGTAEILDDVEGEYDVICCPVGTGATLAGLIVSSKESQRVIGFSALKGEAFLENDVRALLKAYDALEGEKTSLKNNWEINYDHHFGGFAEVNDELIDFVREFKIKTGNPVDYLYNAKMLFGLKTLIEKEKITGRVLVINTGGLQGNIGIETKHGIPEAKD